MEMVIFSELYYWLKTEAAHAEYEELGQGYPG